MSRSRKKHPICSITTATSDKKDKQRANRTLRRITKSQLKNGKTNIASLREVSSVWDFAKDGKQYWGDMPEKEKRK